MYTTDFVVSEGLVNTLASPRIPARGRHWRFHARRGFLTSTLDHAESGFRRRPPEHGPLTLVDPSRPLFSRPRATTLATLTSGVTVARVYWRRYLTRSSLPGSPRRRRTRGPLPCPIRSSDTGRCGDLVEARSASRRRTLVSSFT